MSAPNLPAASGAGWLPDLDGSAQPRWWDGRHWGDLYQPLAFQQRPCTRRADSASGCLQQRDHCRRTEKCRGGVCPGFLLRAARLLYATVTGGLIMLAVSFVALFFSFLFLGIQASSPGSAASPEPVSASLLLPGPRHRQLTHTQEPFKHWNADRP